MTLHWEIIQKPGRMTPDNRASMISYLRAIKRHETDEWEELVKIMEEASK